MATTLITPQEAASRGFTPTIPQQHGWYWCRQINWQGMVIEEPFIVLVERNVCDADDHYVSLMGEADPRITPPGDTSIDGLLFGPRLAEPA